MLKDARDPEPLTAEPPSPVAAEHACSVGGCAGRYLARGYCIRHYYQVKRHGAVRPEGLRRISPEGRRRTPDPGPLAWRRGPARTPRGLPGRSPGCEEGGCEESPFAHGLCRLHYIVARCRDLLS